MDNFRIHIGMGPNLLQNPIDLGAGHALESLTQQRKDDLQVKKYVIAAFFLILLSTGSTALGREELQFEITRDKIDLVQIWILPDGHYTVDVELKPEYRAEFSTLTGTNVGKRLAIVLSGQVLMNPIIKSKIDSGRIGAGVLDSPAQALKIAERLLLETSGVKGGGPKE
jgi:preprotein translocase subunit SecD